MLLTESRVYKSMPVKLGCTGLCSAAHHSPAAFIASSRPKLRPSLTPFFWLQSPDAPPTGSSLLRQQSGNAAYSSAELLPPNSTQHSLSREFDAHLHALLSNIASVREKACFLSLALPHAGDWIDTPPSDEPGDHALHVATLPRRQPYTLSAPLTMTDLVILYREEIMIGIVAGYFLF